MNKLLAIGKVIVGALGLILGTLNEHLDLIPDPYKGYVTALIGLLMLVGIYHAPYAPIPPKSGPTGQLGGKHAHPEV
jgi:hypothetical protein